MCFMFVFVMLTSLYLVSCGHLLRKSWPFGSLLGCVFLCSCRFLICVLFHFKIRTKGGGTVAVTHV